MRSDAVVHQPGGSRRNLALAGARARGDLPRASTSNVQRPAAGRRPRRSPAPQTPATPASASICSSRAHRLVRRDLPRRRLLLMRPARPELASELWRPSDGVGCCRPVQTGPRMLQSRLGLGTLLRTRGVRARRRRVPGLRDARRRLRAPGRFPRSWIAPRSGRLFEGPTRRGVATLLLRRSSCRGDSTAAACSVRALRTSHRSVRGRTRGALPKPVPLARRSRDPLHEPRHFRAQVAALRDCAGARRVPSSRGRSAARPSTRRSPRERAGSPGGTSRPNSWSTSSGRPTSSVAITGTSIAIASLTTTGIESRSPLAATTAGMASRSADSSSPADLGGRQPPASSTRSPSPSRSIAASSSPRSGPSPRIVRRSTGAVALEQRDGLDQVGKALLLDQPPDRDDVAARPGRASGAGRPPGRRPSRSTWIRSAASGLDQAAQMDAGCTRSRW